MLSSNFNLVDTPDPYVLLSVPTSPQKSHKTSIQENNPNPVWNETFQFHLDPREKNVMGKCVN